MRNLVLFCASLWFTYSFSFAGPLDLSRRKVVFCIPGQTENIGARATAASIPVREPTTVFSFVLTEEDRNNSFALRLPRDVAAKVHINGRPLDVDPLPRSDGDYYRIPDHLLRLGMNRVELLPLPTVKRDATLAGTAVFTLDGSFEEIHFARAFAENVPKAPPPADPLQPKIDVLHYDCTWVPSLSASVLTSASVAVTARCLESGLTQCVLDFDSNGGALAVSSVDSGVGTSPLAFSVDSTNKKLRITLPRSFSAGEEFVVRVNYSGTPNPSGTFGAPYVRSTHGTPAVAVVYTFSEPYGARQWWPCKDLPDDKASSSVQRIVVPKGQGWQVVSNGKLEQIVDNGATQTWVWVNHYPIATYLVSFCVSNYIYVSSVYTSRDNSTTMTIAHAIYPENIAQEGSGAAGTLQVMNFFADRFGEYPFLDEKYYTATHNSSSGMEHQTCTSMPGGDVMDGMQRRNVHELAHQWFGDKITPESFDHLWLNEGFATYCEALWDEYKWGRYAFWARVNGWSVSTTQSVAGPSSDNFSLSAVYRKGAWVLHMLRNVVGEDNFWEIMRTWAQHPAVSYGNATSSDFETVAESVAGMDLTAFFAQWLWRSDSSNPPAQPTYRFKAASSKAGSKWNLAITTTQAISGNPYVMPLDYEVVCQDNATTLVRIQNSTLTAVNNVDFGSSVPLELDLDPDNWVLKTMGLSIATCSLGKLAVGQPFQYRLQARYGSTPYTWSSGSGLPPGLTLASNGLISGTPTTPGVYAFSVSVTDNSGSSASTTLVAEVVAESLAPEIIVESRTSSGSTTPAPAYQETGTFANTTSKSGAPRAVGSGARYSVEIGAKATFRPAIPVAGFYDVYVTLDDRYSGPNNDANVAFAIQHDGPDITGQVYLHPYTPGLRNQWLKIASKVLFQAGAAGAVGGITFTNLDGDGTGANPQNRFCADAVKFVFVAPAASQVERWQEY
ncbi:MAG: M1 family aminopeptidase [Candidatus Sumerlaeaceae bacterium]|nr:M1 family aminopeptidase [Candidatus Sumerlaeaceae bacterium]